MLPVDGARLTSGYGGRWGTFHYGIDLAAPMRTPEYAAADGVVLRAGAASGFGLAVYILHENGDVTVYGHMDEILVEPGDYVDAGETIALLGNRGQSTGPHLHFEVHEGGDGRQAGQPAALAARARRRHLTGRPAGRGVIAAVSGARRRSPTAGCCGRATPWTAGTPNRSTSRPWPASRTCRRRTSSARSAPPSARRPTATCSGAGWSGRCSCCAPADRSVTDICMDVGFASLGTFSRVFRDVVGEPPSAYRPRGPLPPVPTCFAMAWARTEQFRRSTGGVSGP